ncbi:MAG: hypothetical protein LH660_21355 [Phormidesmis sp. CAN_BIN36]|nr:hypothetical protein [Phormidesmis sp. CAN_BIN36]
MKDCFTRSVRSSSLGRALNLSQKSPTHPILNGSDRISHKRDRGSN